MGNAWDKPNKKKNPGGFRYLVDNKTKKMTMRKIADRRRRLTAMGGKTSGWTPPLDTDFESVANRLEPQAEWHKRLMKRVKRHRKKRR